METKNWGISESKARIEGGSAAATRLLNPLSLSAGSLRPGPRRQGIGFASLRALDCCGPSLGDSLFMRERGNLQRRGSPPGRSCTKERFCNVEEEVVVVTCRLMSKGTGLVEPEALSCLRCMGE